jgi:hypothetical protein
MILGAWHMTSMAMQGLALSLPTAQAGGEQVGQLAGRLAVKRERGRAWREVEVLRHGKGEPRREGCGP